MLTLPAHTARETQTDRQTDSEVREIWGGLNCRFVMSWCDMIPSKGDGSYSYSRRIMLQCRRGQWGHTSSPYHYHYHHHHHSHYYCYHCCYLLLLLHFPCSSPTCCCSCSLLLLVKLAFWWWRRWQVEEGVEEESGSDWVRWLTGKLEPTWTHVPCCRLGVLEPYPGFPKNSCLVGNCSPHNYNLGTYLTSPFFLLPPSSCNPSNWSTAAHSKKLLREVNLGRFDSRHLDHLQLGTSSSLGLVL